jgi:tetratricopeptide (TPR) repeat protein
MSPRTLARRSRRPRLLATATALALSSAAILGGAPPAGAEAGSGAALGKPKKGLDLSSVADTQQDPVRARLDAAVALLKSERYDEAARALHELLDGAKGAEAEVRYQLGKALYRLGQHHAALGHFAELLRAGPKSRFYSSALEWCLFLSRKMTDAQAVDEVVAQYATGEFPKDYRDEFFFRLARFHYTRALQIETGAIAGKLGETRVEETVTGGMSFQGDIFSDGPAAEAPKAEPRTAEPKKAEPSKPGRGSRGPDATARAGKGGKKKDPPPTPKTKKKDGGGISIDADLFGDDGATGEDEAAEGGDELVARPRVKAGEEPAESGKFALTAKEHTEAAERLVVRVEEASKWGPKARFLEGLLLYKQNKPNEALDAFKKVVRLTKDGEGELARLREAAFFQLARTHFGAQQPSFSIFYYGKVERETWAWLDALYEASWAEFRLGSYEKALGNLLTLHSPFFQDQYFPESQILKGVIYYENCRYAEAKGILGDFLKRYEPVLAELKRLTESEKSAAQYFELLQTLRTPGLAESGTEKSQILEQVLKIALSDPELKRLDAAVAEVDREVALLGAGSLAGSGLAQAEAAALAKVRDGLARDAGRAVRKQLEKERDAIKLLVQQAIRIDVETSRSEQERIESELREVQSRPKSLDKTFVEWADDEKLVWPFDGEYWRDELGTYELTLAHSCR